MSSPDLFEREYETIKKCQELLAQKVFPDKTSAKHYQDLLHHYKKLFSQLRHLVKISDIQQKELSHLNHHLVQLSQYDPLTGVPNRRYFEEELDREWRRHQRLSLPLSLIMIDIDHFKLYNDLYGHSAGDDCLRKVAQTLAVAVNRPSDLVARFGGEEFICVLPQTTYKGACAVGQRILEMIRLLDIPHKDSQVAQHVSISLGIATLPHPTSEHDLQDIVGAADQCLYLAKGSGRNRFESICL